jgi:transposase
MLPCHPIGTPRRCRCFETFTPDLIALADWLRACRIRTVAMESTGVFWIPLFQILEDRGLEVCLVNARHVKNVPGRKTDVLDSQWLQYLHSVGLRHASFRPQQAVCALRALLRHRDRLVQMSSQHIQHVQKALSQMNVQLHHVISDIPGATGLAILDAIPAGERNPETLAKLRDRRIKASAETVAKSLVGDYRPEHLFTLRRSQSRCDGVGSEKQPAQALLWRLGYPRAYRPGSLGGLSCIGQLSAFGETPERRLWA